MSLVDYNLNRRDLSFMPNLHVARRIIILDAIPSSEAMIPILPSAITPYRFLSTCSFFFDETFHLQKLAVRARSYYS